MTSSLDRLAAIVAEMTSAPWEHIHVYEGEELIRYDLDRSDALPLGNVWHRGSARGIVALRNTIEALLQVVRAAEETFARQTDYQARWAMEEIAEALTTLYAAIEAEVGK